MSADAPTDDDDGRNWRRVLLLLLVLLVAVTAGVGITTFVGDGPDDDAGTPTVELTPTSPPSGELPPPTTDGPDDGDPTVTPTRTDTSTASPEPPSTATPDDDTGTRDDGTVDAGGGGTGGPTAGTVDVEAAGSGVLFQYADVAPGDGGRERLVLRNVGTRAGRFVVADVAVTDDENGIVGPEATVDGSPASGELSAAVHVVVSVQYADGTTEYLFGTGTGPRSLAAVADAGAATGERVAPGERATVVVDWEVPRSTGNEIQSDELTADVTFQLRGTGR